MPNFSVRFSFPTGTPSHWKGIFRSLLVELSEIMEGRKKATTINHFWRERLTKDERRMLIFSFSNLIRQLQEEHSESSFLTEEFGGNNFIPRKFLEIWKLFGIR